MKGVEWMESEYEEMGLCGFAARAELIVEAWKHHSWDLPIRG